MTSVNHQYGYLQYQLLPYKRIQEYFTDPLNLPISEGSLYNFNHQAFTQLAEFEHISKDNLADAEVLLNGSSNE